MLRTLILLKNNNNSIKNKASPTLDEPTLFLPVEFLQPMTRLLLFIYKMYNLLSIFCSLYFRPSQKSLSSQQTTN